VNASIIGSLIAAVLVFAATLLVPIISKRLNKADAASANAERAATSAEKISGSAMKIVERLEKDCARCDERLSTTKTALESLLDINEQIVPLLPVDHKLVEKLITTLHNARRALWD
jgi:gas vesicle protein